MTKQEAQTLVERLGRIWSPQSRFIVTRSKDGASFQATLRESIRLEYATSSEGNFYCLTEGRKHRAFLAFDAPFDGPYKGFCEFDLAFGYPNDEDRIRVLQEQWLPFFRRGCWLSGFDIPDATDEEQAEWMQGFSREEINAWNLKF